MITFVRASLIGVRVIFQSNGFAVKVAVVGYLIWRMKNSANEIELQATADPRVL
jgi:hypothetical protein